MINMKRIRIRKSILILGIVILVLAIGLINRKYAFPYITNTPQSCREKCPEEKYFITKRDNSNNIISYDCVNNCPTSDNVYTYLDIKTKECRVSCSNTDYFVDTVNKICYPLCDV